MKNLRSIILNIKINDYVLNVLQNLFYNILDKSLINDYFDHIIKILT
jgi:hypothetical protein